MADLKHHHAVVHAVHLRRQRHDQMGPVGRANDWMATHLAVVFGIAWTIWVFFIVPIVAYFLPQNIQNHIFFFSSGWIQLFALPLMVYVGNRLQHSSDAQSDVQHQALTHIAVTGDDVKTLLAQNTELTKDIRDLATEIHHLTVQQRLAPDTLAVVAADAKAARTAAESAFVATQALAAKAMEKPGPGELAAAVRENTEAVQQVHRAVTAVPEAPDPGPAVVRPQKDGSEEEGQ